MTQDSPYNVHAPVFLRERREGVKQGNFRLLIHASFKPLFAALRHAFGFAGRPVKPTSPSHGRGHLLSICQT